MNTSATVNSRVISFCMVGLSAFVVLSISISAIVLAAALVAAVINDAHPLIFVFTCTAMLLSFFFFISIRVLLMELTEYRRDVGVAESADLIEDQQFNNCTPA